MAHVTGIMLISGAARSAEPERSDEKSKEWHTPIVALVQEALGAYVEIDATPPNRASLLRHKGDASQIEAIAASLGRHADLGGAQVAGEEGGFNQDEVAGASAFYSAVERTVERQATARASAAQWLATIQKAPGVKKRGSRVDRLARLA